MGLLDDAIREHLELKRLRGADPSDVARLEREALGPVRRGAAGSEALAEDEAPAPPLFDAEHAAEQPLVDESQTLIPGGELGTLGQETAELDMESVIAGEPAALEPAPAHEVAPAEHELEPPEPELEEFVPRRPEAPAADTAPHPAPASELDAPEEEPVEDVLEETPSFLQQTPEHDRLWFEQQPPRDFDFDK